MFIRPLFKYEARRSLSGQYPTYLIITSLFLLIPAIFARSTHSTMMSAVLSILFAGPLLFAMIACCLTMSRGQSVQVGHFFQGLSQAGIAILAYLWQYLWIILWSLLFIVPGIIKALSYSMQLFLVAEYPHLSPQHALRLSQRLTQGYKWELFLLNCSFIGWFFLILLTFGLALLYVAPYYYATMTHTYLFLKEKALSDGRIREDELELPIPIVSEMLSNEDEDAFIQPLFEPLAEQQPQSTKESSDSIYYDTEEAHSPNVK